jgi:hypothetical protein
MQAIPAGAGSDGQPTRDISTTPRLGSPRIRPFLVPCRYHSPQTMTHQSPLSIVTIRMCMHSSSVSGRSFTFRDAVTPHNRIRQNNRNYFNRRRRPKLHNLHRQFPAARGAWIPSTTPTTNPDTSFQSPFKFLRHLRSMRTVPSLHSHGIHHTKGNTLRAIRYIHSPSPILKTFYQRDLADSILISSHYLSPKYPRPLPIRRPRNINASPP